MANRTYTVRDGDTLDNIAEKYSVTRSDLLALNALADETTLLSGTVLNLPDAPAPVPERFYETPDLTGLSSSNDKLKKIEGAMPVYTVSDALQAAAAQLAQMETEKPGEYVSTYEGEIARILNDLENRKPFSYNPASDPLYDLYRQSYERQGKMAMLNAAANAASLTGGFANSYAASASAQAYQNYLNQFNDMLPALYQQSYDRYEKEGEALSDALSRYRLLDAAEYDRWRGTVDDYYEDLTYFYNRYNDMSDTAYKTYESDLAAWQKDRDYWYEKVQDEIAQANWQKEYELSIAKAAASGGGGGGGSSRRSSRKSSSSSSASASTNYTTYLNGLKESIRVQAAMGKSRTTITKTINARTAELQGAQLITAAEAKNMKSVATAYYNSRLSK